MTTIKGTALVTFVVPFEFEIDEQEFEEWAEKPISEATPREIQEFMESDREPWEHEATWPKEVGWWTNEVYGTDIDHVDKL